jgi:hypothetical protein
MCNASPGSVGHLRRNLGFLLGVACVLVAHSSAAAPAPTFFRLTITGTAHQEWSYTAPPVVEGACQSTETSAGIRTVKFNTRSPVLVRLSGGRVLPVTIAGIKGTVTLTGANTTDKLCGSVRTSNTLACAGTTRSFSGARIRGASPRPGVLALAHVANVRLAQADCPFEPEDVRVNPLGPQASLLRLPKEALRARKAARITLSSKRLQRKTYGSPENGHLEGIAEWTLTFVRIPS